ncbi:fimbrial protein [Morganella morganii]|uniref:fimbrial protein n=1 Tax=Morganella morganii TaxID=582 RepID=UPI0021D36FEA|nr:fimbrial protein [Morganella morganii]MCU6274026.1 fimbrial protein [Morganella morganii]
MMNKNPLTVFFLFISIINSLKVYAYDVDIEIKGEIHIPPCIINNGEQINVDFKNLPINEIDGVKHKVLTSVNLQCDYFDGDPYISLKGNRLMGGDDNTLDTLGKNAGVLGISLYQGDSPNKIIINSSDNGKYGHKLTSGIDIFNSQNSTFTFTAVPTKIPGKDLVPGDFTSSAVLEIHYI